MARVSAVIHENSRYQDPEATTYTNIVARAQHNFYATSDKGWQRISVPFTYEGNKTPAFLFHIPQMQPRDKVMKTMHCILMTQS